MYVIIHMKKKADMIYIFQNTILKFSMKHTKKKPLYDQKNFDRHHDDVRR